MLPGLIGRKIGMTQFFSEEGEVVPVTAIEAGPCWIVQKKTQERDGYTAIQLGFKDKKVKHTTKPLQGHFQKSGVSPKRWLREFRVDMATQDPRPENPFAMGKKQIYIYDPPTGEITKESLTELLRGRDRARPDPDGAAVPPSPDPAGSPPPPPSPGS